MLEYVDLATARTAKGTRLATDALVPADPRLRAEQVGWLELVAGEDGIGWERVSALDIYVATFLTPLSEVEEAACPQMSATLRRAFASARELLGDLVPDELWAHRTMMFERHLEWPIRLS